MFEDDGEGGLTAMHHPFTSPKDMNADELKAAPEEAVANAYDMVINGYEVGGGSVRIHRGEMQQTVFGILGINEQEQREKFGFLLDALKYGTPPHAGLAFGLDRLRRLTSRFTPTNAAGNARLPAGLSPCCRRWWGSPPLPDALSSRQGISLPQARFYAFNPRRHILAPVTKRKTDFFAVTRGVVRTVCVK